MPFGLCVPSSGLQNAASFGVRRELALLFTVKREREIWAEYQAGVTEEE